MQPGDRVGVRARALLAAVPDVGPADAAAAVGLGDEVGAVGPGVDQDAVHLGDPAAGERLDHARVAAQRLVALVELVDGHVRLAVGLVLPGRRRGPRRARRPPCRPAPSSRFQQMTTASRRISSPAAKSRTVCLRRLAQLDRGEAPALADALVAAQDRRGQADLVGRQRVERVRRSCHADPDALPSRAAKQPSRRRMAASRFGAPTVSLASVFEYEVDRGGRGGVRGRLRQRRRVGALLRGRRGLPRHRDAALRRGALPRDRPAGTPRPTTTRS